MQAAFLAVLVGGLGSWVVRRRHPGRGRLVRTAGILSIAALLVLMGLETNRRLDRWEFASGLAHRNLLAIHESSPSPVSDHFVVGGLLPSWEDAFIFREGFQSALRLTYDRPEIRTQLFSRGAFDNLVQETSADTESIYLDFRMTPCGPDVPYLISPLGGADGELVSIG
jgi:hypothetical protein